MLHKSQERKTGMCIEYVKIMVLVYIVIMNLIGFAAMGVDKRKARRGKWRIKEATLFLLSLIGGSIGTWLGMYIFHHKTRHWYFVVGMPGILVLQIILVLLVYNCI